MLCSNRFPLPGSPSTCTIDTAIIPLPSFLLVVGFAILWNWNPLKDHPRVRPSQWLHVPYFALVVAAFGMSLLEIARLAAEHLGVGLLPVSLIALGLVLVILWRERRDRTLHISILFASYWFLLTVFETLKSVRLHRLVVLNPTTTKTSKYPSSDQFLDIVVMLGIFFVLFCFELITLVSFRHTLERREHYLLQSA